MTTQIFNKSSVSSVLFKFSIVSRKKERSLRRKALHRFLVYFPTVYSIHIYFSSMARKMPAIESKLGLSDCPVL